MTTSPICPEIDYPAEFAVEAARLTNEELILLAVGQTYNGVFAASVATSVFCAAACITLSVLPLDLNELFAEWWLPLCAGLLVYGAGYASYVVAFDYPSRYSRKE